MNDYTQLVVESTPSNFLTIWRDTRINRTYAAITKGSYSVLKTWVASHGYQVVPSQVMTDGRIAEVRK